MDSPSPLDSLIDHLDGWTVVSCTSSAAGCELRLVDRVKEGSAAMVHARLLLDGDDLPRNRAYVGGPLRSGDEEIDVGGSRISTAAVAEGQILDWAIRLAPRLLADPMADPNGTTESLRADGSLIWPPQDGEEGPIYDLDLLDWLTYLAFSASPLIVTIETAIDDGQASSSQLFLTPWAAVEARHDAGEGEPGLEVSYFPTSEIVGRLLERSGLARLLSIGKTPAQPQQVTVQITYADDTGLSLGALQWQEGLDGLLTDSDGTRSPTAVASEVLTMLPSGDEASPGSVTTERSVSVRKG